MTDASSPVSDLIALVQREHAWLERADRWLAAHPNAQDEARYLERLTAYEALYRELIAAIQATARDDRVLAPAPTVTQQAMDDLAVVETRKVDRYAL